MQPFTRVLVTLAILSSPAAFADQGWFGLGFRCHAGSDPSGRRCESLVVVVIAPKGPAARAGLRMHDVIVAVDGKPARFRTHRDALDQFRRFRKGQTVAFDVIRLAEGRLRIRAAAEAAPPESTAQWKKNDRMADETDGRRQRKSH